MMSRFLRVAARPTTMGLVRANMNCSLRFLSETGYPSAEYHRNSTRYSFTPRHRIEQIEKEWKQPQYHWEVDDWRDKIAYKIVKFLRHWSDKYFGRRFIERACLLETVAAVPGLIGAMALHLRSLRKFRHSFWIKPLMDEAENERMHLMTFMSLVKPTFVQRMALTIIQGGFLTVYFMGYVISPRISHRFVGYLEEEAVHTYTELLRDIDAGLIPNVPAPSIAKQYWNMPDDATLRDVVLVIRADEADHRDANHKMAHSHRERSEKEAFEVDLELDFSPKTAKKLQEYIHTTPKTE